MNTHDVPMILFTVVTQMCVGAFLVLGTAHVGAAIRGRENSVVERTSRPSALCHRPGHGIRPLRLHVSYGLPGSYPQRLASPADFLAIA